MEPRGIRNNNPGNLRPGKNPWDGQTFVDHENYCVFSDPAAGIRALVLQLRIYQKRHGIRTIQKLVERWAPHFENNVQAYVDDLVKRTGAAADQHLDFDDPNVMEELVHAMIWHENGKQPYELDFLNSVIAKAMREPI